MQTVAGIKEKYFSRLFAESGTGYNIKHESQECNSNYFSLGREQGCAISFTTQVRYKPVTRNKKCCMWSRQWIYAPLTWTEDVAFLLPEGSLQGYGPCLGRTVGRVVKARDCQPRDRGFESRRMLSLLYLESLSKICTLNVLQFTQP